MNAQVKNNDEIKRVLKVFQLKTTHVGIANHLGAHFCIARLEISIPAKVVLNPKGNATKNAALK